MSPKFTRRFALIATLVAVGAAIGEIATVHLKSGQTLTGDVAEIGDTLSIRNADGLTRVPKAQVERVDVAADQRTLDREYERRLARLADDDVAGHFALANWAYDRDQEDWARARCEHVLRLASDHFGAATLLARLDQPTEGATDDEEDELPTPPRMGERDINRLKLYELGDPGAGRRAVRLRAANLSEQDALMQRIAASLHASDAEEGPRRARAFIAADDGAKLRIMVDHLGMKFADAIVVDGEPAALWQFRREVLPLVRRGCASTGCHAARGPAERFRLPGGSLSSTSTAYATFLLLDQLETADGPLINRSAPAQSVLLDYLLPSEYSARPHPPVDGPRELTPVLRNRDDSKYRDVVSWIATLAVPHPEYDLEYVLPPLPADPNRAAPNRAAPNLGDPNLADQHPNTPTP